MQQELCERALKIDQKLAELYPDAQCALNYRNPWELLVATVLSAQCTDERVNIVTEALFAHFPTPEDMAQASQEEVEADIKTLGLYRSKAKNLILSAQKIMQDYEGEVPEEKRSLVALPGVGSKTANVVLGNAFGVPGIPVDTHCRRVSRRLGLSTQDKPELIEKDLNQLIPQEHWTIFSHRIIDHGRKICRARVPLCEECSLRELCPQKL